MAGIEGSTQFIRYEYCVSLLIVTLRFHSRVRVVPNRLQRTVHGVWYSLITLGLGVWGVPWGLVWSPLAIWRNLTGGEDVSRWYQFPDSVSSSTPPEPALEDKT